MMRVLIVDDGELARQRLEELTTTSLRCEVVGSEKDGKSAIAAIRKLRPDLVFLDIQLPDMSGIDVVTQIGIASMPHTIFVTAYDNYAVRAFELAAVDYLLKPFDDDRFEQALRRAERWGEFKKLQKFARPLRALLEELKGGAPKTAGHAVASRLERFAVESGNQVRLISVGEVDYISACGHYAELHCGGRTHLIRERMDDLEQRLDSAQFLRIHRSVIVQLRRISMLTRESGGDYAVTLATGQELAVSRNRIGALEQWMGLSDKR